MKNCIILLCLVTLFIGCDKNYIANPPTKFTGCRITKIVQYPLDSNINNAYFFVYNADGTVSKIYCASKLYSEYNHLISFIYSKNSIIAMTYYQNNPSYIYNNDSITLDAQNRVSNITNRYGGHGTLQNYAWETYTYNTIGNLQGITYILDGQQSIDTLNWQNGDITNYYKNTNLSYNKNTYTYFYYDTVYNTGNVTAEINNLISYGRSIYNSTHLTKYKITQNGNVKDTTKYSYQIDNAGKITYINKKYDLTDSTTLIYYECE